MKIPCKSRVMFVMILRKVACEAWDWVLRLLDFFSYVVVVVVAVFFIRYLILYCLSNCLQYRLDGRRKYSICIRLLRNARVHQRAFNKSLTLSEFLMMETIMLIIMGFDWMCFWFENVCLWGRCAAVWIRIRSHQWANTERKLIENERMDQVCHHNRRRQGRKWIQCLEIERDTRQMWDLEIIEQQQKAQPIQVHIQ